MNNKNTAIIILLIFLLNTTPFLMNISHATEVKPISNTEKINNMTSFHGNISNPIFWYAIKATFLEPTNITIQYVYRDSVNGSSKIFFFDLMNSSDSYSYYVSRMTSGADPDYYFQFHLGRLNWSYHHDQKDGNGWGKTQRTASFNNMTGTWFFTYVSYSTECMFDVWINTSEYTSFSVTQGTEVFAYDRHDFFGNINIGGKRGTVILNGLLKINIKNRLFAWFDPGPVSTGFEKLKYQSPAGDLYWNYFIDIKGLPKYTKQSDGFRENLRWGLNGTWSFMVNMMNIGKEISYPNVFFLGADIRLPE